ncbi:ATP-binding cassette domain-containing protein [Spiribacter halobius]|uniref:Fe3+-hydroxamate ABC transporter ATP-binding protein FhuC n=1 Tax=Sediminicurvatus halobius TaxID=2182432 RepID=A0A2U2N973_9GAMM|nr:ATP-binding cassette domain-containing protein [Spiribacter halobius]PWG65725.1 Fe3+-hydroxamate ABC transporter ATP-binding protein FhuC [Spiribacter halobius]UEX77759.1 ATP-binding cassette domain-containing protein [Spiribacter halobius]
MAATTAYTVEAAAAQTLFALQDVTFRVDGRTLLGPVDLTLAAGQVHGLIGHNGSGKTSLLRLLARQQPCSSGHIRFAGRPLDAWPQRALAREIAYLAQSLPASTGLTVRELTALGRYPWHGALGRFGAEDRAQVEDALALTDMQGLSERLVDTLSGGERQRAWIAMLVAQNARCLLLDEPISALDIAHQVDVMGLLQRLSHERGLTVITVLHDVNMAARYCDELIALQAGRLIERGEPATILQPERLERIYGIPMGVMTHPRLGVPIGYVA